MNYSLPMKVATVDEVLTNTKASGMPACNGVLKMQQSALVFSEVQVGPTWIAINSADEVDNCSHDPKQCADTDHAQSRDDRPSRACLHSRANTNSERRSTVEDHSDQSDEETSDDEPLANPHAAVRFGVICRATTIAVGRRAWRIHG
jgi:hypothetical protein